MTLRIIGAGFGRTGTLSLKMALEQLGLGPCHHMMEIMREPERAAAWLDVTSGERPDWDAMFDGYRSTVDWPACAFWKELAAYYPDAKILLSQREATGWYERVSNTIYRAMTSDIQDGLKGLAAAPSTLMRTLVFERTFGGRFDDRAHAIDVYERHNQDVRDAIEPERLLVYEPGEGWEPLCTFFEVPTPDASYPHVNSTRSYQRILAKVEDERGR